MLVVDAGPLFEVVADTAHAEPTRRIMAAHDDLAAPHLVDAEVLAVIQTQHRRGLLDGSAAARAVADLRSWPAQRWPHGPLLQRAWELRTNVRGYDAMYVALAERLDAALLTADARLAHAAGPRCEVVLVGAG
ncbi:type II toxin-antitoxin system VapC family toxin [Aquipuribacter nitratireducens]|uniref:Ribonuclease VapC n=1 Tax=Aquipuribacter nitratireducens TaxID=650104 RepID=A0ABW0GK01_9MICO